MRQGDVFAFGEVKHDAIDDTNTRFYNRHAASFDKIPFDPLLPEMVTKFAQGKKNVLEIGSGPGAFAQWLQKRGHTVLCLEPAFESAKIAEEKGLHVLCSTLQNFTASHQQSPNQFDMITAISSLIHIPKSQLPTQIEKIANLLVDSGLFFVSFIEGEGENFEDPTGLGMERFFSRLSLKEFNTLLSPFFDLLEVHSIHVKKMNHLFLLAVLSKKPSILSL